MSQSDQLQDSGSKHNARPRSLFTALLIGALIFLGLILLFEGLFRWTRLDQVFTWRSLGVYHGQFEIKWFTLKDYARQNRGVDVLLLGNSMVNTGIDPDVLSAEYEALTGETLRVFNFGIEGLTIAPNSVIARILAAIYHPGTIIFVTEIRDYAAANGLEIEQQLLSDEWMVARQGGEETPRAWLSANSTLLQHLMPYRNWSRADFPDTFLMQARRFADTTPSGYEADASIGENIAIPPDPADPDEKEDFALFANFSIDPGRLANLSEILELGEDGTQVIITEMPVHPNYFTYFGGEQAHERYLETLIPFIEEQGGIFLPAPDWQAIPLFARADHHHLNNIGAILYSRMLAGELSRLCLDQSTCLRPAMPVEATP